jgi:BASS family bile acid:Na+ symporter
VSLPGLILLLAARWSGVLTLAGLVAISLAIGHLLGGPAEDDRTVLAIACATRHIGIASLVAASVPGPRTSVLVGFYILTSAVISIPYLRWRRASISQVRPHRPNEARASPAN